VVLRNNTDVQDYFVHPKPIPNWGLKKMMYDAMLRTGLGGGLDHFQERLSTVVLCHCRRTGTGQ
jgi:hypothetical protein